MILKLVSRIIIIKNKCTIGDTPTFKSNFNWALIETLTTFAPTQFTRTNFESTYNAGNDVVLIFDWVNNVEIKSEFKNLTKTAKVIFPRNLNFDGVELIEGKVPIFGRGDRIIIQLGYEFLDPNTKTIKSTMLPDGNTLIGKEVFRGYITKINFNTPLELECEDQMFFLKQSQCVFPNPKESNRITLENLMKRMLTLNGNGENLKSDMFLFAAPGVRSHLNTVSNKNLKGLIPVFLAADAVSQTDTKGFKYNSGTKKSISVILDELKDKLKVVNFFFDDFGNLMVTTPFLNPITVSDIKKFTLEENVIDYSDMDFQRADQIIVKIIVKSKIVDGAKKQHYLFAGPDKLKYIGDNYGNIVTEELPPGTSKEKLDSTAQTLLKAQKYTGYAKGSTMEIFGEPSLFIGQSVQLTSINYPEKNGTFQLVGVTKTFVFAGYRKTLEIGIGIEKKDIPKSK